MGADGDYGLLTLKVIFMLASEEEADLCGHETLDWRVRESYAHIDSASPVHIGGADGRELHWHRGSAAVIL